VSRAFFFAHLTAWGLIWAHVMFYYGAFAHKAWKTNGGRWRDTPRNAAQLVRFTAAPIFNDLWCLLRCRKLPSDRQSYRWEKAHRMAFFIAMAAVTYTIWGITMAIIPDRTQWGMGWQLWSALLVFLTQIAGLGHLFTAVEHKPRQWRWFVVAIALYYPVAMVLFNGFYFGTFTLGFG
jgi:hypothetical protein